MMKHDEAPSHHLTHNIIGPHEFSPNNISASLFLVSSLECRPSHQTLEDYDTQCPYVDRVVVRHNRCLMILGIT